MSDKYHQASTQFYIVLPAILPENFDKTLQDIVARERVVSMMIEVTMGLNNEQKIQELITLAQDENVAVLLGVDKDNWEQGVTLLKQWGCDGLHVLDVESDVKAISAALGNEYILGSFCGVSRHDAMKQGENGVDYLAVGFEQQGESQQDAAEHQGQEIDPILGFIGWYMEVFELPLVAWHCPSLEMAEKYIAKGSDFIALNEIIWEHDETALEVMTRLEALSV